MIAFSWYPASDGNGESKDSDEEEKPEPQNDSLKRYALVTEAKHEERLAQLEREARLRELRNR